MGFKIREANASDPVTSTFSRIKPGDWFLDGDGDVCRRNHTSGDCDNTDAILVDGSMMSLDFDDDSVVTPIDVEIVWRRKTPGT